MEGLITIYILGCIISFVWAFINYCNLESEYDTMNLLISIKHITWGRLIFSIVFLGGFIAFCLLVLLFFFLIWIIELIINKKPLKFLGNNVFKNK